MLVVNEEDALERMGGDEALYEEIIEVFLDDTPTQIAILHEALGRQDMLLLRRQAHSIKSAAANVGAERLAELALQIEQAADRKDLAACLPLIYRLDDHYAEVSRFFSA